MKQWKVIICLVSKCQRAHTARPADLFEDFFKSYQRLQQGGKQIRSGWFGSPVTWSFSIAHQDASDMMLITITPCSRAPFKTNRQQIMRNKIGAIGPDNSSYQKDVAFSCTHLKEEKEQVMAGRCYRRDYCLEQPQRLSFFLLPTGSCCPSEAALIQVCCG